MPPPVMKRYEDDYRSDPRRRPEPREDRHGRERVEQRDRRQVVDDRMDIRGTGRVDPRDARDLRDPRDLRDQRDPMDTGMDARIPATGRMDPRANAAARLQPRGDQYGVEPRAREPELYKDPRTGQTFDRRTGELYQEVARGQRGGYIDDPMDRDVRMDRDDIPPTRGDRRNREPVDLAPARGYHEDEYDQPRSTKYNDYFVPGPGIDREVIQHEICRYLGNDATVRPFTNKDGRQGFVVRAYRALTSAMIDDLKRDSARWRQEQDRRSRSGRSTGSYADMKGREEPTYVDTMDVDMDDFDAPARTGRRHDVDPRRPADRHAGTPVSTGYASEPGYYVSSNPPGNYGPETLPRSHQEERYRPAGGNNTPPASRAGQSGYSQATYPTSRATAPPVPASSYRDPRTGQLVSGYESSFPTETSGRSGRHR